MGCSAHLLLSLVVVVVARGAGCRGAGRVAPALRGTPPPRPRVAGSVGAGVLRLRGGAEPAGAGVADADQRGDGVMDAELSPELSAILADPVRRELAYNITIVEFHRERVRAGGTLSDEKVARYFYSHMLLRHPDLEPSDYSEEHWKEFACSFCGVSDTEENQKLLKSLNGMWAEEATRGTIASWETAREEDMVNLSEKYVNSVRRPLLHVPRDMQSLDEALPELADGGTLLVGGGDFVPAGATLPGHEKEQADGDFEEEEERTYAVEGDRHALLIRGSFVERGRGQQGAGSALVSGDESTLQGDDSGEQEAGKVIEVGEVSDIVTRVWGRWELAGGSHGQVAYLQMLLRAPDASHLTVWSRSQLLLLVTSSSAAAMLVGRACFDEPAARCVLSATLTCRGAWPLPV